MDKAVHMFFTLIPVVTSSNLLRWSVPLIQTSISLIPTNLNSVVAPCHAPGDTILSSLTPGALSISDWPLQCPGPSMLCKQTARTHFATPMPPSPVQGFHKQRCSHPVLGVAVGHLSPQWSSNVQCWPCREINSSLCSTPAYWTSDE